MKQINGLLDGDDPEALYRALADKSSQLSNVDSQNASWYLQILKEKRRVKQEVLIVITDDKYEKCLQFAYNK